ncbi:MAG TPA: ribosome small subunit-dependent GTPase A [Candidatus Hydrogenedentes bacterium]|nr:ribosome small subunit-dependent GTPase A [Candidatus Hydrogenedentota bacterium]HOS03852.1 ribosome small subunit-dependent GTPase A [Candidatus Hydrogenedentota bacterium]
MSPKKTRKTQPPTRQRRWHAADATFSGERRRERSMRPEEGFAEAAQACFGTNIQTNGVVVSPYGVLAFVKIGAVERLCGVDDALVVGKNSVLAPGDAVQVAFEGDKPFVRGVATRRTWLSRLAIGRVQEQVIAANVDVLLIVTAAAQPAFKRGLVDRFLIAAQHGGVEPALCINKIDLTGGVIPEAARTYQEAGLPVYLTSCTTREGVPDLWRSLRGKRAVFAGHSGVGKSSLINAYAPELAIATQTISNSNEKGKHTTTQSRIYSLPGGIQVIDTPGIRQLGLWGVSKEELHHYFPEMERLAGNCRFRNCSHVHEPGCSVLEALESGELSRLRYASYLRIRESLDPVR